MNWMKKYVLPGKDPLKEIKSTIAVAFVCVFTSNMSGFFMDYNNRKQFYGNVGDFADITRGALVGAVVYGMYRIIKMIYEMGYFSRSTRSIYVMRRLDEGHPLLQRTLPMAMTGICAALVFALVFFAIDYLVYRYMTPRAMLPETYHLDFWGALLW